MAFAAIAKAAVALHVSRKATHHGVKLVAQFALGWSADQVNVLPETRAIVATTHSYE